MLGEIITDLGVLILGLALVYGAYRLMQWQAKRDRASDQRRRAAAPPVTAGGATDGSEDDGPPAKRRAT